MIAIAVLVEALGPGGAERLIVDLARNIDRSRFRMTVYSLFGTRRHYAQALHDLGVPETCLGLSRFRELPRGMARFTRLLRENRPDLVHTHLYGANIVGRFVARGLRIPVLSTLHSADYEPEVREGNPGLSVLKHRLVWLADRVSILLAKPYVVAVSAHVAESARRRLGIPRERLEVVPNAVDTTTFRPVDKATRLAVRRALGLGADDSVVAMVGRMAQEKGHSVLLKAAARLGDRVPALRVLLAGDGEERSAFEALAKELGIDRRVSFLGVRRDVPSLMAASDIVAVPSVHEGFGLVVAEALACGVPVIASRTGPIPEIVREGETGLLFAPGDDEGLARCLEELMADPPRRARMGERGRGDAVERFSLVPMVQQMESLYERIHSGAGSVPRP
jgi:glycosyltransferase involved in cell wall biosynthesis